MKLSKELMRDFAKVVLPKAVQSMTYPDCWFYKQAINKRYYLDDWQTVIELAQKWCDKSFRMLDCEYVAKTWSVQIVERVKPSKDKHLPTAIMKAVVAAAKSEGI